MQISKSQTFKAEYCATCVRIGEMYPIEGKDRIVKTIVNGLSIVIGKNDFKPGDVAIYCANETAINEKFLHCNSMFEDKALNADTEKKGYINKYGRVRIIKLGGVPSYGLLLNANSLAMFLNESVHDIGTYIEQHINEDFDEINNERFIQVYLPVKQNNSSSRKKIDNKEKKFKILIDGSLHFHYDTDLLSRNITNLKPDDEVDISVKVHGTSAIISNILTNVPTPWYKRLWKKYILKTNEYDQKYNIVYASRKVVKNEYINKNVNKEYYSDDVWGYWAKKLEHLIPKDYCIYGEIVGFTPDGTSIQSKYDYGCNPHGEEKSKFMVYRITANKKEMELSDVIKYTEYLKNELGDIIMDFPLLYHGTLPDLYPDIDVNSHWHENVLERLKTEKKFLMECDEPLCTNKVPREGFVLRICNDPLKEAFKLKCFKFLSRESSMIDSGNVDIEMQEEYGNI